MEVIDPTGQKFGRLTAVKHVGPGSMWLFDCDCGNTTIKKISLVKYGNTRSCGCLHKEQLAQRNRMNATHGSSNDRLYGVWRSIKQRCYDKNNHSYKHYGGRGIKICDEWVSDFGKFKEWALATGYRYDAEFMKCTIDRIDNDKDYSPDNCRWVDMKVQARNRRNNRVRDNKGRFTKAG